MQIEGCVALVTGANRGLGKAYAEALLTGGAAKVYAAARDPAAITDRRLTPLRLDVTSKAEIAAAAASCPDVNLLINNAGIMLLSPMLAAGAEDSLRREMEVNVFGLLAMAQAFTPILARNGGGALVNMLSVVSWFVNPFNATYCASKHAALAVTDGLRIQLKAQGTQVCGVYAGFIDTDMVTQVGQAKSSPEEVATRALAGLQAGESHILADASARQVHAALLADPHAMEAAAQRDWDHGASPWAH
jgi:NAD(P)-dependent dehydrogenase (short-subunit alcohol dehydrogenase family)